jgi:hypothetical protein
MLTRSTTFVALFSLILLLAQCKTAGDPLEKPTDVVDVPDARGGLVDTIAGEGGVEAAGGDVPGDVQVGPGDMTGEVTDAAHDQVETLDAAYAVRKPAAACAVRSSEIVLTA